MVIGIIWNLFIGTKTYNISILQTKYNIIFNKVQNNLDNIKHEYETFDNNIDDERKQNR